MIRAATSPENELHRRRSLRWAIHVGAVLLLALVALIRYYPSLTRETPRADERVYLQAFAAVAAGESPYAEADSYHLSYYYPPPLAALGAAALGVVEPATIVIALRAANLLGLGCCLWISFLFAPLSWRWCLAAAAGYVALGPVALDHGLRSGNLSLAVVGAILGSLAIWRRWPVLAGLVLGLSAVVKPIAPVGMTTLAAHRPSQRGRKHLLAAGLGLTVAAALMLASPFLREYLQIDGDINAWPLRRSVSLYRWLHLGGVEIPPGALVVLVAVITAWLAHRNSITPRQLYILAIVGMTLATPANWSHTLLLALPISIMALSRAWKRLRSRAPSARISRSSEFLLVSLGVAALQFADGIGGGLETAPVALQILGLVVPVWAPVALGIYVWGDPESEAVATLDTAKVP